MNVNCPAGNALTVPLNLDCSMPSVPPPSLPIAANSAAAAAAAVATPGTGISKMLANVKNISFYKGGTSFRIFCLLWLML